MAASLFRKLLLAALVWTGLTVAIQYMVLSSGSVTEQPEIRTRVVVIGLAASIAAILVGLLIYRSLNQRVSRLKRLAEGLLGGGLENRVVDADDDLASLERSLTGVALELRTLVENLRSESARREAILSGMTEGVLAVDRDLRVTFSNSAFLRAVGFRGESCEGLSLIETVRQPELQDMMRGVLASGAPSSTRLKLSAATPRVFSVQAAPLESPAGRGVIAIFHDITELERLEQVRKDFVANVSHELRTPLAGIIGYADTLLDGALEEAVVRRNFVEIIRSNAVRLSSIASDLLVLSELESGVESAEPETISVRGVLDAGIQTVESEARARNVTLVTDEIQDAYVLGSRLRLEQALLNLLANAIKFNKPGGEVRIRVQHNPDATVTIQVADTGAGIPSQDLPRIFERFYRVDRARSRQVGGTGLGLSIVKHVVERMNGVVSVESILGQGSTFSIRLPAAASGRTMRA
jgi:two-component system phosphate regulon sensor histidine kinase PhoR